MLSRSVTRPCGSSSGASTTSSLPLPSDAISASMSADCAFPRLIPATMLPSSASTASTAHPVFDFFVNDGLGEQSTKIDSLTVPDFDAASGDPLMLNFHVTTSGFDKSTH